MCLQKNDVGPKKEPKHRVLSPNNRRSAVDNLTLAAINGEKMFCLEAACFLTQTRFQHEEHDKAGACWARRRL